MHLLSPFFIYCFPFSSLPLEMMPIMPTPPRRFKQVFSPSHYAYTFGVWALTRTLNKLCTSQRENIKNASSERYEVRKKKQDGTDATLIYLKFKLFRWRLNIYFLPSIDRTRQGNRARMASAPKQISKTPHILENLYSILFLHCNPPHFSVLLLHPLHSFFMRRKIT